MHNKVTRSIDRGVERELWARAAGRCEFDSCNKPLYLSPVTQERVNIAEKAHIHSFSKDGPRGWGPFTSKSALNSPSNLMLVCPVCHLTMDADKDGTRYSAEQLMIWKREHEDRVGVVTGITPEKKSHVVLYGANIGEEYSKLDWVSAVEAMFPARYPAEENPVVLSMSCEHEDSTPDYWATEERHLKAAFERHIAPRIREETCSHFSLFALAPQPLLTLLGSLFTDKIETEVYQLHREPRTWQWQGHPDGFAFTVNRPLNFHYSPALILSLSDRVAHGRVTSVLGENVSIWEVTVNECHNDFLRSSAQLSMFRDVMRKLMVSIKEQHGQSTPLNVFPAMPVSCAVELGRIRTPKADMPWIIYDQNNKAGGFVRTIRIPGGNHG